MDSPARTRSVPPDEINVRRELLARKALLVETEHLGPLAAQIQQTIGIEMPTPVVELGDPRWSDRGVRVLLKREDLTHPLIRGNKWRKLKYNLAACVDRGCSRLVTAGGAFSNHILAVAAAGHALGLDTLAFIRGESPNGLNPVLLKASQMGMQFRYVQRQDFHAMFYSRTQPCNVFTMQDSYFVPAGGSNELGLFGVGELMQELTEHCIDIFCCPCGTGGTAAGIASQLISNQRLIAFAALKGQNYLENEVTALLTSAGHSMNVQWMINHDFQFGGYARTKPDLVAFIRAFHSQHAIQLDPIYTAKMMYGLDYLIRSGQFAPGTTILAVHTGGIVGLF